MHNELVGLMKRLSYRRRPVILASGRTSDFYVDARETTLNARGAELVGRLMLDALDPRVQGVGGLVTGADPIAGAIAATSSLRGRPVHGFMVRKEPKTHGTGRRIEGRGNLPDGSLVCVIEDTVTTGASLLLAVDACVKEGLVVVQCMTLVDREEGGAEAIFAATGLHLTVIVRRHELES